nr:MAG TPA: hypothetical protein [Caudoviricetes sp.]
MPLSILECGNFYKINHLCYANKWFNHYIIKFLSF